MHLPTLTHSNLTQGQWTQELEELFREHAPMIYRTAFSVTRNPQDAEDVVQTLFLGFLRRGISEGLKENPQAYLYRAAVNLSLNLRLRGRDVQMDELTAKRLREYVDVDTSEHDEDIQRRLAEAFSQLNVRHVEMLVLRYEYNYSEAQIAKLLGKSRSAVAVTLFRARARLKRLLNHSLSRMTS